jgi:hypothetical protein
MRSTSIRSVLRTAIAMGVVAAYQSSSIAHSWLEFSKPQSTVCFFHDLEWIDVRQAPSPSQPSKAIERSGIGMNDVSSRAFSQVFASEADTRFESEQAACLEASRHFHRKSVQDALQSINAMVKNTWSQLSSRLYSEYGVARNKITSVGDSGILKLVTWIQLPDAIPVAYLVADSHPFIEWAPYQGHDDWNCIDRESTNASSEIVKHPFGNKGNVFVVTLDQTDSAAEFSDDLGDAYFAELGTDDEVDGTLSRLESEKLSAEMFVHESTIPIGEAAKRICEEAQPTSSAITTFQVGVDPVCSDTQVRYDSAPWSSYSVEERVCYPLVVDEHESAVCALVIDTPTKNVFQSNTDDVVPRPPTLESDSNWDNSGVGHCVIASQNLEVAPRQASPVDERVAAEIPIDQGPFDEAAKMFGTDIPLRCFPWMAQRFHVDSFRTNGILAPDKIEMFTREDLLYLNEDASPTSDLETFEIDQSHNALSDLHPLADKWHAVQSYVADMAESLWSKAKDTATRSLNQPVNASGASIMDSFMAFANTAIESSRVHTSKNVAKQIRSVGQFLVEFAMQIETQAERIALAKGKESFGRSVLK